MLKINASKLNNNIANVPKQLNKPLKAEEHVLNMCKLMRNYKEFGRTTSNFSNRNNSKINSERRLSTGTLNRLILVAQALESEVQYRRQIDINGKRIVIALRTINLLLLFTIDGLILSGVGQYYSNIGGKRSLMLTPNKWYFNIYSELPATFSEMRLNGQYFATAVTTVTLIVTIISHTIQLYWCKYSRLLCMCYSFCAVPFMLFVFGLEIYYSTCPWINDYYRFDILRRDYYNSMESYFDMQCGISGWALAAILSVLSCSLFISEGLVSAFFRSESTGRHNKIDAFL
ncbi:Uncharacterized protein BM_BM18053 [Brugia malayi]|uniref:Uncharacterized protein n=1 Tax=Brugia malayi TaxID=6279 RepID=A0A4E9EY73_BRUMA|nr:Uncharacterized protein BM_BM18053 [Brugia malayi]VIO89393.1 Uncharacterized protein BM_BM18053 [Brugia malayi]